MIATLSAPKRSETRTNMKPRNDIPEMPDQLEKDIVQVIKLLSHETRLRIMIYLIREGELHGTAMCERLHQSQPAVSDHLALRRVAGLIAARRDGKHNFYSIRTKHFRQLLIEVFANLDRRETDEIRFDEFVLSHSPN